MSDLLHSVHPTVEGVATVEYTPPHPPREETPAYHKAHLFLVHTKKSPCSCCGVTIDTLGDAQVNLLGSRAMETHHYPIERSLMDACDPLKVHRDFPTVYDRETLASFVDSPQNLLVLCDVCHRSPSRGIHHLLTQDWVIQKYLLAGYQIAGSEKDSAAIIAHNDAIEVAAGEENALPVHVVTPTVTVTVAATPPIQGHADDESQ